MYYVVSVLIIIASIILILIVLIQNSKGGGLASGFSSPNQLMGVRKTTDFLEKATWYLAIALLVLSLTASLTIPRGTGEVKKSKIENQINSSNVPVANPNNQNTPNNNGNNANQAPANNQPANNQPDNNKQK
jgi:preprotein translocase subunit SecG